MKSEMKDRSSKKENRALTTIRLVLKNPGSVAGIIIFLAIILACIIIPLVSPYT